MSKRKRNPTFAACEKEALLDVVGIHFSIIESKKTDAESIQRKANEWRKIATEFNAISAVHPRAWKTLKNCWENLKKRARYEFIQRNRHSLGTGGGPQRKGIVDPLTNRVLELIQRRPNAAGVSGAAAGVSGTAAGVSGTAASVSRAASATTNMRPTYKSDAAVKSIQSCSNRTIRIALKPNDHVQEESEIKTRILHLQIEKEKEILRQEKFKTKQEELKLQILELELRKLQD